MTDQNQSNRSVFPSTGGKPDQDRTHYNISPIQVGNEVRDGDEFILITRSRQSEGFQLWSSTDQEETEQLYRQAAVQVLGLQPA